MKADSLLANHKRLYEMTLVIEMTLMIFSSPTSSIIKQKTGISPSFSFSFLFNYHHEITINPHSVRNAAQTPPKINKAGIA